MPRKNANASQDKRQRPAWGPNYLETPAFLASLKRVPKREPTSSAVPPVCALEPRGELTRP